MKPILLQAELPPGVTLIVKKESSYSTCYNIYIKGHWFRSWFSFTILAAHSTEEAVKSFVASYYGDIVTTDTSKYPEEFL